MSLELNEVERAVLMELLTEAILGTNYALAPRPRQFTSILRKLHPSPRSASITGSISEPYSSESREASSRLAQA